VHTLDTGALTDLAEPQHGLTRHRLLDEIAAERILVLGTTPLLWELPALRAKDEHLFRASLDLLVRITRSRVLLSPPTRHEDELRARGPLPYPAFMDPQHGIVPDEEPETMARAAAVNEGHARGLRFSEMEQAVDAADALQEEARRQARASGEQHDPRAWRRSLKRAPPEFWFDQADYNAQVIVRQIATRAGLDPAGVDHRNLPSFWGPALIHAARVRAVLIEGTSPAGRKSVSKLDLLHLEEAAAYADVFVTTDRRLRVFAERVCRRCEVISLDAWAHRLTR
jgi:hypothetical protein